MPEAHETVQVPEQSADESCSASTRYIPAGHTVQTLSVFPVAVLYVPAAQTVQSVSAS